MKNTIINILIFVLAFNVIMIIFPEGKTQKYCKLTIKLFIIIYIINNIFLNSTITLDSFLDELPLQSQDFEHEISIEAADRELIDMINQDLFEGDEVIGGIRLRFKDDMSVEAVISLERFLDFEQKKDLQKRLAEIFDTGADNIQFER